MLRNGDIDLTQKRVRAVSCWSMKAVKHQNDSSKAGTTSAPRTSKPEFPFWASLSSESMSSCLAASNFRSRSV